jgi:hypothetical protein
MSQEKMERLLQTRKPKHLDELTSLQLDWYVTLKQIIKENELPISFDFMGHAPPVGRALGFRQRYLYIQAKAKRGWNQYE